MFTNRNMLLIASILVLFALIFKADNKYQPPIDNKMNLITPSFASTAVKAAFAEDIQPDSVIPESAGQAIAKEPEVAWSKVEKVVSAMAGEEPRNGAIKKEITLIAKPVFSTFIKIDGLEDEAWKEAGAITAWDPVAKLNMTVKALYDSENIYLLVSYGDADESREHKTWKWDKNKEIYAQSNAREDVCVLKWNLEDHPVDLSVYADNPYRADIWFWKACRTDPSGYADDKMQILSSEENRDAMKVVTRNGNIMYLTRKGDDGVSAYDDSEIPIDHTTDVIPTYSPRTPTKSRADIKARGYWEKGIWTIEFARKLKTGHDDDLQFDIMKQYTFGISRYEIAGRTPNRKLSQPLFGSGDVYNLITLSFGK